jgi:hypothetical protein
MHQIGNLDQTLAQPAGRVKFAEPRRGETQGSSNGMARQSPVQASSLSKWSEPTPSGTPRDIGRISAMSAACARLLCAPPVMATSLIPNRLTYQQPESSAVSPGIESAGPRPRL